jgi:hypothetical protein
MNWLTLEGLDEPPEGWLCAIREAGYEGVQFIEPLPAKLVENARDCFAAVLDGPRCR